jgi:carbonic anhydrase/acetyltransferase-like protein (isoleucine patch superfamily)
MVDSRGYAFEGSEPKIDPTARVSREATLVGDVSVAADASVWPGVVLRGDVAPVHVGMGAHVGDNAVLHASEADDEVMVGHGAVLNDTVVASGAMVGFNATVTDSAIGARSIVAPGTVVPDGYEVPPESFVRGTPASVVPLSETDIDPDAVFDEYHSGEYTDLAQRHGALFE